MVIQNYFKLENSFFLVYFMVDQAGALFGSLVISEGCHEYTGEYHDSCEGIMVHVRRYYDSCGGYCEQIR